MTYSSVDNMIEYVHFTYYKRNSDFPCALPLSDESTQRILQRCHTAHELAMYAINEILPVENAHSCMIDFGLRGDDSHRHILATKEKYSYVIVKLLNQPFKNQHK